MNVLKKIQNRLPLKHFNKFLNKTYIPNSREHIYIEPSSFCNLNCVFCAYGKKNSPKTNVSLEDFKYRVKQATSIGFSSIGLTPITGDIFMDKGIYKKFDFLENDRDVKDYHFFTNGIIFDQNKIDLLLNYKKLSNLSISIYGHNSEYFVKLSRGSLNEYKRLVKNISYLSTQPKDLIKKVSCNIYTTKEFNLKKIKSNSSELLNSILKLQNYININVINSYNNWGGLITQKDVDKSGISISSKKIKKIGACSLIFYKIQIMADGTVNACACRDSNATLAIGNINKEKLSYIISNKNKRYMDIIENQQKGLFNEICTSCDYYRSIYLYHDEYKFHKKAPQKLDEFLKD